MKYFLSLMSILLLSFSIFAQNNKPTPTPTPSEEDDVVKISTTLIQIDVTVTDKNGKIVKDLKPEDFELFENGKKQKITNFLFVSNETPNQPAPPVKASNSKDKMAMPVPPVKLKPEEVKRTIAIVVDDLGLSFESMVRVRSSLKRFVDEQMQPNDLVAIVVAGNGIGALQQFTSDKNQLYAAIEKLKWNSFGRAGITPFAPSGQISMNSNTAKSDSEESEESEDLSSEIRQQVANNNFYEDIFSVGTLGAINYVVKGMNQLPGRKSVMLLSDGFPVCDMNQQTGEADIERCQRMEEAVKRLTDLCNRASVSIYSFDARGLVYTHATAADDSNAKNTTPSQMSVNQEGLRILSEETGGLTFFNRNDLTDTLKYALEDQKGYYLLAYEPDSDAFDPKKLKFNKIKVTVKGQDYNVRTRSGFFGFVEEKSIATNQNPQDKTFAALISPFSANEIGLRLNTLFGTNETGAFVNSYLHIDAKNLTFVEQPDGSKKLSFDVMAASYGENGVTIDQVGRAYRLNVPVETQKQMLEEGFVYSFVFPIKKPGAFQMRVAVRDAVSSKVGSANQLVEVPDLKKGNLTLSGIILENFTDENAEESQSMTVNDITVGKGDPRTDTSLRKFQQGTFLRYAIEVFNPKFNKSQKAQLQTQVKVFHDGKPILNPSAKPFEAEQKPNQNKILFGGKLALGDELPPGEYILQIIVKDTLAKEKNNLATQWVQFEIVE